VVFTYQLYFLFRNIKRVGVSLEQAFDLLVEALKQVNDKASKPIAFALSRDSDDLDAEKFRLTVKQRLLDAGVPTFGSVKAAGLTLVRMNQFRQARERLSAD
jgi:hypothetical protein